jgi:hypothetical protein
VVFPLKGQADPLGLPDKEEAYLYRYKEPLEAGRSSLLSRVEEKLCELSRLALRVQLRSSPEGRRSIVASIQVPIVDETTHQQCLQKTANRVVDRFLSTERKQLFDL